MSDYIASVKAAADADVALSLGDIARARGLYARAGELQLQIAESLPPDRAKTRCALALSSAALLYKANDLTSAERLAHRFLAQDWLDDPSRHGLEEVLERVWNERRMGAMGVVGNMRMLSCVLRGPHILQRLAPQDLVDTKTRTMWSYIRRFSEWCNKRAFVAQVRSFGPDTAGGYRLLESEAAPSSYRVDVYLTQNQLALDFDGAASTASPGLVVDSCIQFARLVADQDEAGVAAYIPDDRYRGTLVRLVRELVPDGHGLNEVELREPGDAKELTVRLRPQHRESVNRMLRGLRHPRTPEKGREARQGPLHGLLRAVDLDRGLLRLVQGATVTPIHIPEELYDIIGPMLNKDVVVHAHMPPRHTKTWEAEDIEPADSAPD